MALFGENASVGEGVTTGFCSIYFFSSIALINCSFYSFLQIYFSRTKPFFFGVFAHFSQRRKGFWGAQYLKTPATGRLGCISTTFAPGNLWLFAEVDVDKIFGFFNCRCGPRNLRIWGRARIREARVNVIQYPKNISQTSRKRKCRITTTPPPLPHNRPL